MTTALQAARKIETDRAALEIIAAQKAAREAKTARLREARLARDQEQEVAGWKPIG